MVGKSIFMLGIASQIDQFIAVCVKRAAKTLPLVFMYIQVKRIDVRMITADNAKKTIRLSAINLPGMKTAGRCHNHQKKPNMTLEVRASKRDS